MNGTQHLVFCYAVWIFAASTSVLFSSFVPADFSLLSSKSYLHLFIKHRLRFRADRTRKSGTAESLVRWLSFFMTIHHLNQAMQECTNGHLEFNQGEVRAFLYGKTWYPLRATINRAAAIANENNDLTTDRALVQLVYLGVWTRVADINFQTHFPVYINNEETIQATKELSKVLFKITN